MTMMTIATGRHRPGADTNTNTNNVINDTNTTDDTNNDNDIIIMIIIMIGRHRLGADADGRRAQRMPGPEKGSHRRGSNNGISLSLSTYIYIYVYVYIYIYIYTHIPSTTHGNLKGIPGPPPREPRPAGDIHMCVYICIYV